MGYAIRGCVEASRAPVKPRSTTAGASWLGRPAGYTSHRGSGDLLRTDPARLDSREQQGGNQEQHNTADDQCHHGCSGQAGRGLSGCVKETRDQHHNDTNTSGRLNDPVHSSWTQGTRHAEARGYSVHMCCHHDRTYHLEM